jgi:hypothetical protein
MSCLGFTGADVAAREKAAGYAVMQGATEVLVGGGTPMQAVVGTHPGGEINLDWSFTTGTAKPFGQ